MTAAGLAAALVLGTTVPLVPAGTAQRAGSSGKTLLAVWPAEASWRAGRVEVLAWVDATSRASVLSGYLEAAAAPSICPAGPPGRQQAAWPSRWLLRRAAVIPAAATRHFAGSRAVGDSRGHEDAGMRDERR